MPRELGGTNGRGTNPEQLFPAAYTSSFLGIVSLVAAREGIALPSDAEIDAGVAVGATPRGFGIEVELRVCLPGLPSAEADALVEKAHTLCPYSNATRDNIADGLRLRTLSMCKALRDISLVSRAHPELSYHRQIADPENIYG
jgi:Ohr subfamily peroxiredoxin